MVTQKRPLPRARTSDTVILSRLFAFREFKGKLWCVVMGIRVTSDLFLR